MMFKSNLYLIGKALGQLPTDNWQRKSGQFATDNWQRVYLLAADNWQRTIGNAKMMQKEIAPGGIELAPSVRSVANCLIVKFVTQLPIVLVPNGRRHFSLALANPLARQLR